MKDLLIDLDVVSRDIASVDEEIAELKFTIQTALDALTNKKKALQEAEGEYKAKISENVVARFKETGVKKFEGGVGVQERKELIYDADKIFDWALEKKMFLTLDKKSFEKVAMDVGAPDVREEKKIIATFPKVLKLED